MRKCRRVGMLSTLTLLLLGCSGAPNDTGGNDAVYQAWREQHSHVEVTANGSVARILGVREGYYGRHEGFLLHLRGAAGRGLTVKVEDNIDLTGPVPLRSGDEVEVRGEYIYDSRGGILHYTHRDPRGRHPAGYILLNGTRYW